MINTKEHWAKVQQWNKKFGKKQSNLNAETELCLFYEEFWELCRAYRRNDKAELVDACIDLYYYYLFHIKESNLEDIENRANRKQIPYKDSIKSIAEWLSRLNNKFATVAVIWELKYIVGNDSLFNDYFDIVDRENHEKIWWLKNGKITKPDNRWQIRKTFDKEKQDLLAKYGIWLA